MTEKTNPKCLNSLRNENILIWVARYLELLNNLIMKRLHLYSLNGGSIFLVNSVSNCKLILDQSLNQNDSHLMRQIQRKNSLHWTESDYTQILTESLSVNNKGEVISVEDGRELAQCCVQGNLLELWV